MTDLVLEIVILQERCSLRGGVFANVCL